MADRHGCEELRVAQAGHHHVGLREGARGEERGFRHQQQGVAAEQRAVVVGVLGEHDVGQLDGGGSVCHASQFTQSNLHNEGLNWRIIANEDG
ncbi:hypothetical protein D3C84_1062850 [compost metagenome]